MVRYWCGHCEAEHDNARECPVNSSLDRLPKGSKVRRELKNHQRRQRHADYRAPKGTNNSMDNGCVVAGIAMLSVPTLLIWGAVEAASRFF